MCYVPRCIRRWRIPGRCIELTFSVTVHIQRFDVFAHTCLPACLYNIACHAHTLYLLFENSGLIIPISSTRHFIFTFCLTYPASPKMTYSSYDSPFAAREKEKHATLSRSWNMLVNFNDPIEVAAAHTPVSLHFRSHFIPLSSLCISPL